MRLLLVEDSVLLRESLQEGLSRSGYAIDIAADGEAGLRCGRHNPYDIIILDLNLPKLDGLSVLQSWRDDGIASRVLILTARDAVDDRVRGLRLGADDYLVKPFAFDELLARLEALTRRSYDTPNPTVTVGDLTIDTAARKVTRGGRDVPLSRREYMLLEYLAHRAGEVVPRLAIEDHLYDERQFPMSNAVDRMVCAVRRKLGEYGDAPLIHTRRGLGYLLEDRRG